jgi:hypothetical protein
MKAHAAPTGIDGCGVPLSLSQKSSYVTFEINPAAAVNKCGEFEVIDIALSVTEIPHSQARVRSIENVARISTG